MKQPLIILTGPTASGKTALSVALAKRIGGEIISADSMQVYRHMDVGSAKVTEEEMDGVPHHLINVLEPAEAFNVVVFQDMAKRAMERIRENGHIPIVAGGTGFYIQALLYDIDFTENDGDMEYRHRLEALAETEGPQILHQMLRERDPESAEAIHENNVKRVIRALEFYEKTGEKTGVRRERGVAHRDGSPHGTAHIWVVRPNANGGCGYEVLLQKRSEQKDSYPGCYDISSAGHLSAGEEYLPTAVRELREELGIRATADQLHFIGMHQAKSEAVFHGQPFKDHEISAVYLYQEPVQIENLKLQNEEVESVRWMDYQECREKLKKEEIKSCIRLDEFEMIGKALGCE
mgnify:CR=1 FL=1